MQTLGIYDIRKKCFADLSGGQQQRVLIARVISAIALLKIGSNSKIKSDSSIALISSSALAIGVAVTSVTTGMNTDVCN